MSEPEWLEGPALHTLRVLAGCGSLFGRSVPRDTSVFQSGDEVRVVLPRVPPPEYHSDDSTSIQEFVGVLVEEGSTPRICRPSDGLCQWWWWEHVVAWRRPIKEKA